MPEDDLFARTLALIAELPTYGYRRIHALLRQQAEWEGWSPPNHERVWRVMKAHGQRPGALHRHHLHPQAKPPSPAGVSGTVGTHAPEDAGGKTTARTSEGYAASRPRTDLLVA
ncbi:IS3 family transposase [Sabulicella rubraurantiaca]|uniref:IS3 family transposase n=1 Tax=Sabulicella rubraurantiaca TaxID=2811429 RepID=UPI001A95F58C